MLTTAELYPYFLACNALSTDTRSITEGAMFFALKGPNFNANSLASKALELGAKYAVVDEAAFVTDPRILLVNDGLTALQALAKHHRSTWEYPVIGLTGSNGKTTSKELIHAVLSVQYRSYATKGNLNNHIGVPLTILNCPTNTEVAIIEMGANHQQEIAQLCQIAQPTIGLITNIGKAHLEGFGGLAGVRKGKGELFDYLANSQGTVFINGENETLLAMASERTFKECIIYQIEQGYLQANLITEKPMVSFEYCGKKYQAHIPGKYNFENIVNALAIAKYLGVDNHLAAEAAAVYNPNNNRSQFIEKGSNMVLMDAYNANPSSMQAAIQLFNELEAPNKMVILGDMYELGEDAELEHKAIGHILEKCQFNDILLVGEKMQFALENLPKAYYFPDKFGLHNWLQDNPKQHTHILLKGSRGMGLESCLQFI
jgi:UDP-N-acetylmuramoyl-tripeptide--D-alanyl-D-alanine ligase